MWESRATRAWTIYMLVIVGHIIWARRYRVWGLFIMSIVHSPYSIHNNKQQASNQTHIHCDASQLCFFLLIQEHTCQQRVGSWSSWNCLLCGAGNFLASCHHLNYRAHGGKTSGLNGYEKEPQAWSWSFGFLSCCHGEIAVAMFIHQQFDFRRSQFAMGFNVHLNLMYIWISLENFAFLGICFGTDIYVLTHVVILNQDCFSYYNCCHALFPRAPFESKHAILGLCRSMWNDR